MMDLNNLDLTDIYWASAKKHAYSRNFSVYLILIKSQLPLKGDDVLSISSMRKMKASSWKFLSRGHDRSGTRTQVWLTYEDHTLSTFLRSLHPDLCFSSSASGRQMAGLEVCGPESTAGPRWASGPGSDLIHTSQTPPLEVNVTEVTLHWPSGTTFLLL